MLKGLTYTILLSALPCIVLRCTSERKSALLPFGAELCGTYLLFQASTQIRDGELFGQYVALSTSSLQCLHTVPADASILDQNQVAIIGS
jgi:hypothetical protein